MPRQLLAKINFVLFLALFLLSAKATDPIVTCGNGVCDYRDGEYSYCWQDCVCGNSIIDYFCTGGGIGTNDGVICTSAAGGPDPSICDSGRCEQDPLIEACDDGTVDSYLQHPPGSNYGYCIIDDASSGTGLHCALAACGDGYYSKFGADDAAGGGDDEQCDDGDNQNGDGCSSTCVSEQGSCGTINGCQPLEDNITCPSDCYCGNGTIDPQENGAYCDETPGSSMTCVTNTPLSCLDDSTFTSYPVDDHCSDYCLLTYCGDGFQQTPHGTNTTPLNEACDDGLAVDIRTDGFSVDDGRCIIDANPNPGDSRQFCTLARCGDGYVSYTGSDGFIEGVPGDTDDIDEECDPGSFGLVASYCFDNHFTGAEITCGPPCTPSNPSCIPLDACQRLTGSCELRLRSVELVPNIIPQGHVFDTGNREGLSLTVDYPLGTSPEIGFNVYIKNAETGQQISNFPLNYTLSRTSPETISPGLFSGTGLYSGTPGSLGQLSPGSYMLRAVLFYSYFDDTGTLITSEKDSRLIFFTVIQSAPSVAVDEAPLPFVLVVAFVVLALLSQPFSQSKNLK